MVSGKNFSEDDQTVGIACCINWDVFEPGRLLLHLQMSSDDYDHHEASSSEDESESKVDNEHEFLQEVSCDEDCHPTQRSGSVISFPTSIRITDKVQTEQQYLRRLEARGMGKLYDGRSKRRRQKKSLSNGGLHELTKTIIALQSSSSEDESDDGRIDFPTIDWRQAEWGSQESLFGHLTVSDFSSLIGWAHHLKCDNECPQNHQIDVPNIPLAPSMLNFIKAHAFVTTRKPARNNLENENLPGKRRLLS